jgi:hypothetical protein
MAELLLDIALLDLGRRSKPGSQRMAGEEQAAICVRQIRPDTGGKHRLLDQAGDMLVGEPLDVDGLVVLEDEGIALKVR